MDPLSPILTILSAMITPVVLISACATLITSTANRANRVVDRLYDWSAELAALAGEASQPTARGSRALIFEQLDLLTSRARLLQRSLAATYVSLGLFVATSVTIGLTGVAYIYGRAWQLSSALPILFSLVGAASLFYASFLLVAEARLAVRTTNREMDFLWAQGQQHAPDDLRAGWTERRRRARPWLSLRDRDRGE